jgi:hypothetical protein
MDWQWLANGLFVVVGALLGIVSANIRRDMEKQDALIESITTKVQGIELLVAGNYVQKTDLEKITNALFNKLDIISEKLDRKADK